MRSAAPRANAAHEMANSHKAVTAQLQSKEYAKRVPYTALRLTAALCLQEVCRLPWAGG